MRIHDKNPFAILFHSLTTGLKKLLNINNSNINIVGSVSHKINASASITNKTANTKSAVADHHHIEDDAKKETGISFWGGIQLLSNHSIGPALIFLPVLFQKTGILPIVFLLILASILSIVCGWMFTQLLEYANTNTNANANPTHTVDTHTHTHTHENRVEFNNLIEYYLLQTHPKLSKSLVLIYILSLLTKLMSSIIQSSQVLDLAFRDVFGCAVGCIYQFYPYLSVQFVCHNNTVGISPFFLNNNDSHDGDDIDSTSHMNVLSFGFVFLFAVCFYFSYKSELVDNIKLQWFANIGLIGLCVIWVYTFSQQSTFDASHVNWIEYDLKTTHSHAHAHAHAHSHAHSHAHTVGTHTDAGSNSNWSAIVLNFIHAIGISMFNFSFIITIPSWYSDKKRSVNVTKTLLYSISLTSVMYIVIGILAGMAYPLYQHSENLFTSLALQSSSTMSKVSVYVYPIIQEVTTIPTIAIIIRYNLQRFQLYPLTALLNNYANTIALILPWVLSLFFYDGQGFEVLCDWSGIILVLVNFLIPPIIYIKFKRMIDASTSRHQQRSDIDLKSDLDLDSDLDLGLSLGLGLDVDGRESETHSLLASNASTSGNSVATSHSSSNSNSRTQSFSMMAANHTHILANPSNPSNATSNNKHTRNENKLVSYPSETVSFKTCFVTEMKTRIGNHLHRRATLTYIVPYVSILISVVLCATVIFDRFVHGDDHDNGGS